MLSVDSRFTVRLPPGGSATCHNAGPSCPKKNARRNPLNRSRAEKRPRIPESMVVSLPGHPAPYKAGRNSMRGGLVSLSCKTRRGKIPDPPGLVRRGSRLCGRTGWRSKWNCRWKTAGLKLSRRRGQSPSRWRDVAGIFAAPNRSAERSCPSHLDNHVAVPGRFPFGQHGEPVRHPWTPF